MQVIQRLGQWHVWTTLGRPQGLHFFLDLTNPEQKDVAKEIVKLAIKASVGAKAAAKAAGVTASPQHLLNLRGNGCAISLPEDDKMWTMAENSYQTLEFDYAPTNEQLDAMKLRVAVTILRSWRSACHMSYEPVGRASNTGDGNRGAAGGQKERFDASWLQGPSFQCILVTS